VFWFSSTKSVSEVAKAPDRGFLQVVSGDGKIGFSRSIEAVGKDYITQLFGALNPALALGAEAALVFYSS
jgi:hypothetical protein